MEDVTPSTSEGTGTSAPAEAAAQAPATEETAPSEGSSRPSAGTGGDAADPLRKKRRRGKRGGKRHRKKPAGTNGEAQPPEGEGEAEAPANGAATRSRSRSQGAGGQGGRAQGQTPRQRQPRQPRPAKPVADGEQAAGTQDAAAEQVEGEADATGETAGEAGTGAAKRRRRRGGRGRGKKPATPGADAGATTDEAAPAKEPRQPRKKQAPAAGGSTRLAARALRSQQRPRRPRRKLTDEDVARLRGGEKTMLVHDHDDRTQIAVLEEASLIEHYVARRGQKTSLAGSIFLGRVQNVLPGMEAAFVDFGRGRNGVLYAGEVNYSPEDLEGDASPRIEKVLKSGQSLMVQVTKDPIGTKGARLTTQISLAGRYMVLAPEQHLTGISRRLSENERLRLRTFLREMRPNGHGVIIRTAAEGAPREALERDLQNLLKTWDTIQKQAKKVKAPHVLYAEPELVMKVVRDVFSGEFAKVVCDARGTYEELRGYFEDVAPDLLPRLELHAGSLPLFEEYRVTEQLHKALERKVWLPSGGSLVIDRTEALTVVDVNTGKFTGKGANLEDTVYRNNLEAADEVARQLRLRDIGGIIVIDFIDMIDPKHQQELLRTLKRALSKDKTRSQVFEVSNLGLVEMTRKKVSEGLLDAFSEPCPNCEGRGIVITHEID